MELHDAHTPFYSIQSSPSSLKGADSLARIRTVLLTENSGLATSLQRSFYPAKIILSCVRTISLIDKAIDEKLCDVAIVDIESNDEWPGSVFSRFDEKSASFPVIILCESRHEALNYRQRAQHVIDIFTYDKIKDPRFQSIVQAASFREEMNKLLDVDSGWSPTLPAA